MKNYGFQDRKGNAFFRKIYSPLKEQCVLSSHFKCPLYFQLSCTAKWFKWNTWPGSLQNLTMSLWTILLIMLEDFCCREDACLFRCPPLPNHNHNCWRTVISGYHVILLFHHYLGIFRPPTYSFLLLENKTNHMAFVSELERLDDVSVVQKCNVLCLVTRMCGLTTCWRSWFWKPIKELSVPWVKTHNSDIYG